METIDLFGIILVAVGGFVGGFAWGFVYGFCIYVREATRSES